MLDFGLVKQHDAAGVLATQAEGGTPAYMAPEQALGRPVDGRADLYALGCVGYWLLAGRMPFDGGSAIATMVMHVEQAPPPPGGRTENPIPAALERVILDCLEKDPARRPQTADELSARLAACELPAAWTPERARRWWESHRPA